MHPVVYHSALVMSRQTNLDEDQNAIMELYEQFSAKSMDDYSMTQFRRLNEKLEEIDHQQSVFPPETKHFFQISQKLNRIFYTLRQKLTISR